MVLYKNILVANMGRLGRLGWKEKKPLLEFLLGNKSFKMAFPEMVLIAKGDQEVMLQGSDLEKNNMQNLKGYSTKETFQMKHNLGLFLHVGKANRIG